MTIFEPFLKSENDDDDKSQSIESNDEEGNSKSASRLTAALEEALLQKYYAKLLEKGINAKVEKKESFSRKATIFMQNEYNKNNKQSKFETRAFENIAN